jgi:hypothetical protein
MCSTLPTQRATLSWSHALEEEHYGIGTVLTHPRRLGLLGTLAGNEGGDHQEGCPHGTKNTRVRGRSMFGMRV